MESKEISKSKIENRIRKKTNPILVKTLISLKKTNPEVAKVLAFPRRQMVKFNLEFLEQNCKDGERILVPGKVLGDGELTKKIKVVAFSFSQSAREKMKKAKIEFSELSEENPKELNSLKLIK